MIATRPPANAIGWLFLGAGVVVGLSGAGRELRGLRALRRTRAPAGAATGRPGTVAWLDPPSSCCRHRCSLLFPDGRLPSRALAPRARRCSSAAVVARWSVHGDQARAMLDTSPPVENPAGIGGVERSGTARRGRRARRASRRGARRLRRSPSCASGAHEGVERQQFKWFAFAVGFLLASIARARRSTAVGVPRPARDRALSASAFAGLAVAVGVAILRYRLYDIDRVISKTLVYGVADGDPRRGVRRARARGAGRVLVVRGRLEPRDRRLDARRRRAVPAAARRACSGSSTGASTAAATTRSARSRRSARGCASRSTSTTLRGDLRGVVARDDAAGARRRSGCGAGRAVSRRTAAGPRLVAVRGQRRRSGSRDRADAGRREPGGRHFFANDVIAIVDLLRLGGGRRARSPRGCRRTRSAGSSSASSSRSGSAAPPTATPRWRSTTAASAALAPLGGVVRATVVRRLLRDAALRACCCSRTGGS